MICESKTLNMWSNLFPHLTKAGTNSFSVASTTAPAGSQTNWNISSSTYQCTKRNIGETYIGLILLLNMLQLRDEASHPRSCFINLALKLTFWPILPSHNSSPWWPRNICSEADLEIFLRIGKEWKQQCQIVSGSFTDNCCRIFN